MKMLATKATIATLCAVCAFSATSAFAATTYNGDATAVDVSVLGGAVNIPLADAGPLAPAGGNLSDTLVTANASVPLILNLNTGILDDTTMGAAGVATSQSTVNGLDLGLVNLLGPSPLSISATTLQSNAQATGTGVSGSSLITDLVINGTTVDVTGAANQEVSIAGIANIFINQQIDNSTSTFNDIVTNALNIDLLGGVGDVLIGHSEAGVSVGIPGGGTTGGGMPTATPEPAQTASFGIGSLALLGLGLVQSLKKRRAANLA